MAKAEESLRITKNIANNQDEEERKSPLSFLDSGNPAMGGMDEDELRAQSEAVRYLVNFPSDRIWSWTRWKKREIPIIARELTRMIILSPQRPRNPDKSIKRAPQIYYEIIAWLRLAEEGKMREEALGVFSNNSEDKTTTDTWKDMS